MTDTYKLSQTLRLRRDALLPHYDTRAPRYTSYPTALQFTPSVTGATHAQWLSGLPVKDAVSLYVHVPFCERLCWYCGCNTRAVNNGRLVSNYIEALEDELALLEQFVPKGLKVRQLHLGGGTPNILAPKDLDRLFAALKFLFKFEDHAEIAAELDPVTLTSDWIKAAARHGLNRASLGVQTLAPDVQKAVNRPLTLDKVASSVEDLRLAGVRSVNLDLMYGLPKQGVQEVLSTIEEVLPLRPDRLALFGYAHVPWAKAHQRLIHDQDLAGSAQRLEQAEAAADLLQEKGYRRIGMDHFARPSDPLSLADAAGALHRNFQGYTSDNCPTLLAIGASAISRLPQGYVQNETTELAWLNALREGRLPVARGVALSSEDLFRADLIERIMCDLALDWTTIAARHNRLFEPGPEENLALAKLEQDGIIQRTSHGLKVTELGRPFLRSVAQVFDQQSHLENRYSKSI
jgi:oxygen-independent coproporphyrinogen-3 oxidase